MPEEFLILRRHQRDKCTRFHEKCPLFLSILMKGIILTDFRKKHSNSNFHKNPSGGSLVAPCGQTDRHADVNMMKLMFAFRTFCERT